MSDNIYTTEEMNAIEELARVALDDAEIWDSVGDTVGFSDSQMKALQEKLQNRK